MRKAARHALKPNVITITYSILKSFARDISHAACLSSKGQHHLPVCSPRHHLISRYTKGKFRRDNARVKYLDRIGAACVHHQPHPLA